MGNYTSGQVAAMLGISERGVIKAAAALGMHKTGRDWIFTDDDLARLRSRKTKPGRPRKPRDPAPPAG